MRIFTTVAGAIAVAVQHRLLNVLDEASGWLSIDQACCKLHHNNAMIDIDPDEIEWSAIRTQGAGGQNVNKVSTALHLRFDVRASSLPNDVKDRLLQSRDQRISGEGVIIIKAQRYRSQERNREDAMARLREIVEDAAAVTPARRPTRPTRASQRRRVDTKIRHGQTKAGRRKPEYE